MTRAVAVEAVVTYGGVLVATALALYVGTRGGRRRIATIATLAMAAFAVYMLGLTLAALSPDYPTWLAWLRRTWWGAALAPPLWLLVTLALVADEGPEPWASRAGRRFPVAVALFLGLGALFGLVGVATDLVHRWDFGAQAGPPDPTDWRTWRGPLFPLYQGYLGLCALWALANQLLLWRSSPPGTPLRARFGWLLGSALLFLLGGVYMAAPALQLAGGIGEAALVAGMAIMGWNLGRYGALLQGQVVAADFAGFGLRVLAVFGLYGLLVALMVPPELAWIERALPLLPLLMATHVLLNVRTGWLDRRLHGPVAGELRRQLGLLADRVVRQPDPQTALADVRESVDALLRAQAEVEPVKGSGPDAAPPADLRLLVEGALRHLHDLPELSRHPLLERLPSAAAADLPTLERAALLRRDLELSIERLRPRGPPPTPGSSAGPGGWLHYLVLHEAYVEGRPNKQIMQRYHLSEGTFHRARRRAVDAVAQDVYEVLRPKPS